MTFSILGKWTSQNGKLQMSLCILKMSSQATSVPLAYKTNLFEKKQMIKLQDCSIVVASQVTFRFWCPFSLVLANLCPIGPEIYHRQDKSHVLHDTFPGKSSNISFSFYADRLVCSLLSYLPPLDPHSQQGFIIIQTGSLFPPQVLLSRAGPGWSHENSKSQCRIL